VATGQKKGVQKSSMTSWLYHLPFGNQKRGLNNHQSKEPIVRRVRRLRLPLRWNQS